MGSKKGKKKVKYRTPSLKELRKNGAAVTSKKGKAPKKEVSNGPKLTWRDKKAARAMERILFGTKKRS